MSAEKFKLMREDDSTGVWIEETALLKAIKHLKYKNKKLYNYFIERYETLTGKKLDEERFKLI